MLLPRICEVREDTEKLLVAFWFNSSFMSNLRDFRNFLEGPEWLSPYLRVGISKQEYGLEWRGIIIFLAECDDVIMTKNSVAS